MSIFEQPRKPSKVVKVRGLCRYKGCRQIATDLAAGRDHVVQPYCLSHADIVSEQDSPEYGVSCPNCGCFFGVN